MADSEKEIDPSLSRPTLSRNNMTLKEANPSLAAQWHPTKNGNMKPEDFSPNSNKKAWWLGRCGHEWCAVIASRFKGAGCPVCSGLIPEVGVNDLATTHPELVKKWDYERNEKLKPEDLKAGSHKKVWWKCDQGHHFQAPPSRIVQAGKMTCPICSGRVPEVGVNDLATANPMLTSEWHPIRNGNKKPQDFLPKSNQKVWWRHWCEDAHMWHEWDETISNRSAGCGCPYCSNHRLLTGYNDLETKYPDIASEWHPNKNNDLQPNSIVYSSRKKVWWRCEYGHEWQVSPANRIGKDKITGCPICNGAHSTSFPEQAIYYYFRQVLGDSVGSRVLISDGSKEKEADIYIPDRNVVIEYNGAYWHKGSEKRDKTKETFFHKLGLKLFKVAESTHKKIEDNTIFYEPKSRGLSDLDWVIESLFDFLEVKKPDINTRRDQSLIYKNYKQDQKQKGLEKLYPDLAAEWVEEKNCGLSPNQFTPGSVYEAVWLCPNCKSEYRMSIQNRVKGYACPYCAKKRTIVGKTDLFSTNPELSEWWDYELNDAEDPVNVFAGSSKTYWWKSPEGGKPFRSTPESMSKGSRPNPIIGLNDFKTLFPEIAEEWHPDKNGDMTPETITAGNCRKKWWKCSKCGYEWQTTPYQRSKGQGKCPRCNSVAFLYPDLMKEWDYERNQGIDPETLSVHSKKKVYWKHWCEDAQMWHSWKAAIKDRTQGTGCPYCANKKVLVGFNDLATTHPWLAEEWHSGKNNEMTPKMFTAGSNKKVWWLGKCGHEWEAAIYSRSAGTGCPICYKSRHKTNKD